MGTLVSLRGSLRSGQITVRTWLSAFLLESAMEYEYSGDIPLAFFKAKSILSTERHL